MNSFRVVDTKFRILKGGKIGLSLSIALIAGMLMLGGTKATAATITDYFTDVTTNTSGTSSDTTGAFDITVQTGINSGITSVTRTTFVDDNIDSIVIKPTSWTTSYYAPTFVGDYNAVPTDLIADSSTYDLNKTNSPLVLNLTFAVSANSADIKKNAATLYSAPLSGSETISVNTTYNLTNAVSSSYTANLIFNGSNTVSGNTYIDNGNIQIKGNDVTFEKSIQAGSIDINSAGLANLNTISGSTTSDIVFSGNGTANLYGDLTGDVTTTANNQGTLTIIGSSSGKAQTIDGNIGTSILGITSGLSTLNIGETGLSSIKYTVTTINGNVYANSTVLYNGTTASSELILASGKSITSTITTADDGKGILTLEGGAQTVTGQIGIDIKRLAEVNSGADGATSTFVNDVYAVNVTNTGTGTTNFQNDVKATNVNVNAGTTTFQDNLTATTTTITTGTGNFNTVSGATNSNIVFTDTGTANLYGDLTGDVTTTANNQGTLTIIGSSSGKAQTIDGNIGTSILGITSGLSTLNIGETGLSSIKYTVTTINGNVYANSTVLYNGTTASSELILASGKSITSTITTADGGKGILTLVGGTQTVDGTVGAGGAKLAEINTGNGTTTFSSNVYATNLDLDGTGTVNLDGDYTGTAIRYYGDGIVNLADGKNINSSIINNSSTTPTGTLTLEGSSTVSGTVSGTVGTNSNRLKEINAGANGSDSTFSLNVYATNLDLDGTGTVNLDGDYTGTAIRYYGDGIVNLADGKNINSSIINNSSTTPTGTLTLEGSSTVSGTVGTNSNRLKEINAGANGSDSTFSLNVYATNLDLDGTGTVNLDGDYTGTAIRYYGDGIVNLADGKNINSSIINNSSTTPTGTLTLEGSSTVSGTVGTNSNRLKEINAGANGSDSTFSLNVYATNLDLDGTGTVNLDGDYTGTAIRYYGDGIVNLADGKNINSSIINNSSTTPTGTLTLEGSSTVSGTVGTNSNRLKEINAGANGSDSTFSLNVYATNLDLDGTGTVNLDGDYTGTAIRYYGDGIVNLADGKNINSSIINNSSTTPTGTLTLEGSSTVSGTVGTNSNRLKEINAGANGSDSTFSLNVYATNLDLDGTGTVNLDGDYTGTAIRYYGDGIVNLADGKNINSSIINNSSTTPTGTLTLEGSSTVSGTVGTNSNRLKEINAGANGSDSTFSLNVYATNLDLDGTGTVNLDGDYTGTAIRYYGDGIVNLADGKNINSSIINNSSTTPTGTLTLEGSSTVSGTVGTNSNRLKEINAGANGSDSTFSSDVFATTTNISSGEIKFESDLTGDINALSSNNGIVTFVSDILGNTQNVTGNIGSSSTSINTLNIGESGGSGKYSTTTINGDVFATNTLLNNGVSNNSILELTDGSNINSTITTSNDSQGVLTFLGDSIVTGTIGTAGTAGVKLAQINAGADAKTVTFNSSINADNLNMTGNGTVVLADNSNINAPIITATDNEGILTFNGTSTVSGAVGTSGVKLAEINAGASGETVTFENEVNATNLNVTGTGTVNLNTLSGNTESDITFANTGTANLNGDLTGDINFSGNDATVNVSDGKGILGSVQTLASNNTGIINYKGDGTISGNVGSASLGIKEININTNNEQNSGGTGVVIGSTGLARELYADVVNLRNSATLTLKDNVNIINTDSSDNLIITVDTTNTGTVTFEGNSNIEGEVGQSNKVLNTINAGATGKTVTFDDMVYATNLKYSNNGKVVLNGDNSSNANAEGLKGTVNFDNKAGSLEIGDNVNLTTGTSGTQFANANSATLTFNGSSTVNGVLGGNTSGNSTFERIYAGANTETVTFKNDVYVEESNDTTFHVSGTGTVNFEGNLTGDLIYDADGIVNVSNGKSVIVSTVPVAVRTQTNNTGTLNFLGTTTLYSDIGTTNKKLKNVTFASEGTSANSYTMDLSKNIYALNTYIGNDLNNTTVNVTDDIVFGGDLNLRKNTILNVSDNDVTVANDLNMSSNSTLKFKVYTTDISAGQAVENARSGSITANSITLASDTKINITYDGSWYGAGKYNLVTTNTTLANYNGTELNGLVSDNSIIDSVVKNDGKNLTLFADRTSGGSFAAEDLYIEKSEIGEHFSNGASQALAGYANEAQRAGALADIIRRMEELEGGTVLTAEKKAEMVRTQKLLAPVANNSTIKSSLVATNTVLSTISDRISDIRVSSSMDFIPWGGEYSGLSSGDYMKDYALWIKVMGAKATQSKVEDYDGYETTTNGLVAGVDKTLRDGTTMGVALANSDTQISQTDFREGDSSSTKSIQLSAYASKELGDGYVDGVVSYAKHSTSGSRTANSGKLTSSVDADQLAAKVETGYRVFFEDIATFTPFASFEYGILDQKGYSETGTAYQNDALKVGNTKITKGNVGLGGKVSTNLNVGNVLVVPELKLGVYKAMGDKKADIKAQYVGGGNEFVTPTQELTDMTYKAGIGVKTTLSPSTSLMLGVDYDRSKDGSFQGYSGNASFRLSF